MTWTASAEADLAQIRAYVATEDPAAARALTQSIIATADSLAAFPLKGHVGAGGTREWVVPQFRSYLLI